MKTRYFFLLFALGLLGLSSCTDGWRLDNKEDRLAGEWMIDEAYFRENGDLFREDVTRDFRGDRIEFFRDYTAVYDDYSSRNFYEGEWELFLERDYYDDGDDVEFFLDLFFYDRDGRIAFSWNGEVTLLTYEKLNLRVNDRAGVYTFKLRRY